MKTLFLTFLAAISTLSAYGGPPEQTVNELMRNVRAEIPKGWTASYDKEHFWLEISRDEAVWSLSGPPNGPAFEEPEKRKFTFALRVMEGISPAEHHRLSTENTKTQKELDVLYEDLVRRKVSQKFDSFSPCTDSEKTAVARYEARKKSLHDLPDFYFHDIGLQQPQFGSPWAHVIVTDDKIRDECTQVKAKVLKLLSKYEDA